MHPLSLLLALWSQGCIFIKNWEVSCCLDSHPRRGVLDPRRVLWKCWHCWAWTEQRTRPLLPMLWDQIPTSPPCSPELGLSHALQHSCSHPCPSSSLLRASDACKSHTNVPSSQNIAHLMSSSHLQTSVCVWVAPNFLGTWLISAGMKWDYAWTSGELDLLSCCKLPDTLLEVQRFCQETVIIKMHETGETICTCSSHHSIFILLYFFSF